MGCYCITKRNTVLITDRYGRTLKTSLMEESRCQNSCTVGFNVYDLSSRAKCRDGKQGPGRRERSGKEHCLTGYKVSFQGNEHILELSRTIGF